MNYWVLDFWVVRHGQGLGTLVADYLATQSVARHVDICNAPFSGCLLSLRVHVPIQC